MKKTRFTLTGVGKVQVFSAKPPFAQKALLDIGPITNHVTFANNRNGRFAYVTVGGANEVRAYRRGRTPTLMATIAVGELPHGIWPSGGRLKGICRIHPDRTIGHGLCCGRPVCRVQLLPTIPYQSGDAINCEARDRSIRTTTAVARPVIETSTLTLKGERT